MNVIETMVKTSVDALEDKKGETALFNFEVPSKELKKRIRKKSYGLIAQVVRAHA